MHVKQKLAILFYLKRQKVDKKGKIPVYVRITIDGFQEEMSLGFKISGVDWNKETKMVRSTDPLYRTLNKKISQTRVDLERHFDLMQVKYEVATPEMVLKSYRTPLKGERIRQPKNDNFALSLEIDACINSFLSFNEKYNSACKHGKAPLLIRQQYLDQQKNDILQSIEKLSRNIKGVPSFYKR